VSLKWVVTCWQLSFNIVPRLNLCVKPEQTNVLKPFKSFTWIFRNILNPLIRQLLLYLMLLSTFFLLFPYYYIFSSVHSRFHFLTAIWIISCVTCAVIKHSSIANGIWGHVTLSGPWQSYVLMHIERDTANSVMSIIDFGGLSNCHMMVIWALLSIQYTVQLIDTALAVHRDLKGNCTYFPH